MKLLKVYGKPGTNSIMKVNKFCQELGCTNTGSGGGDGYDLSYYFYVEHPTGKLDNNKASNFPVERYEVVKTLS